MLLSSTPASAQLTPSGGSFLTIAGGTRGTASAYDSKNNVFLAVSAYGPVNGRLVKPDGTFASAPFQIDLVTTFSHYPSVAYSPHIDSGKGGYLVTWHQNIGTPGNRVHARLVSATGTPLGVPVMLGAEPTWWESAPMVDYSTVSQVFMVAWRVGAYQIRAARISISGENIDAAANGGAGILVTTSGGERDPSVAYNPATDKFLIAYSDFLNGSDVSCRLVSASTGELGAPTVLGAGTSIYITDSTFSTGAQKYFVVWFQSPGGTTGRLVNADGTPHGNPFPLSSRFGSYDGLSVAYNSQTQSSLVSGHDLLSLENGGVEISEAGGLGSSSVLTNAGGPTGNFYPQLSASTKEGKWLLTTAHNFASLVAQFAIAPSVTQGPAITKHPEPRAVRKGEQVTFTAAATGSPTPTVQWQFSRDGGGTWNDIAGATATSYSFSVKNSDNHKLYRAYFFNGVGPGALTVAVLLNVIGGTLSDFDGDGAPDPTVWRPSNGTFYWSASSATSATSSVAGGIQWGSLAHGDVILSGADIDGDSLVDLVVWRPTEGTWHWLTSSTSYSLAQQGGRQWGNASLGDVPHIADIDRDGKSDLVVWRASTGMWYWLTSSSGYSYAAAGLRQWGNQSLGDKPLTGDFDGDGAADLAVWRASTGEWFWLTSSSGYAYAAMGYKQWGNAAHGDVTLVGDMDGDGRSDLVIWRGSTGTWYWLTSSTGYSYASAGVRQWGNQALGDVPLLTDFDGDGASDLVVFRPDGSGAKWYWLTSSTGYSYLTAGLKQFGSAGDIPLLK
jgi:hypothetical protein